MALKEYKAGQTFSGVIWADRRYVQAGLAAPDKAREGAPNQEAGMKMYLARQ